MAIAASVSIVFELAELSWTERYFWQSASGIITQAVSDAGALAGYRLKFLAPACQITEIKTSEIEFDGDGFIAPAVIRDDPLVYLDETQIGVGLSPDGNAAQYAQMILWRCQNTQWGFKRSIMTRGHPILYWAYDPTKPFAPVQQAELKTASTAWQAALEGAAGSGKPVGTWSIKGVARDPAVNRKFGITSVSAGTPPNANWTVVMDDDDVRLTPGTQIKIGGMRGPWSTGLNRVCTIKTNNSGTLTLVQQKQNNCPIEYGGKGYAKRQLFQLFPINSCEFVRYVVRDTGVTAQATRGRTKARKTASRYY